MFLGGVCPFGPPPRRRQTVHITEVFPPNRFCTAKYSDGAAISDASANVLLTRVESTEFAQNNPNSPAAFMLLITCQQPFVHLSFVLSKDYLVDRDRVEITQEMCEFACTLEIPDL
jgi:hypothetical protein